MALELTDHRHIAFRSRRKTMTTKYETMATFDAAFVASRTDESVVKILTHGKSDDVESFKEKRKQTR